MVVAMKMRMTMRSIFAKQVWVGYDTTGYRVLVRRNGREWGVDVPEEPANLAYRASLDVAIPHPGTSKFPWWRR